MNDRLSERATRKVARPDNDPVLFRRAAAFVPSAIAHICAGATTMTVSSLSIVSYEPSMVSVAISHSSRKGADVLAADEFTIRLLRAGQERAAIDCIEMGTPGLIEFRCCVKPRVPVGDHTMIVAEVIGLSVSEGHPLVYWRRGIHPLRPHYAFAASPEAFRDFITSFEMALLPRTEWTHAGHLAVGAYYVTEDPATAFNRVKRGIVRYNEACGVENTPTSGYHETLTMLWLAIVADHIRGIKDPYEAARAAVEKFGEERDLHHLYYSFDVVRDPDARLSWHAPDLSGPYDLFTELFRGADFGCVDD